MRFWVIQRTCSGWTLICRSLLYPAVKLSLAEKRSYRDVIAAVNFGMRRLREVKISIRARAGIDKSRAAASVDVGALSRHLIYY